MTGELPLFSQMPDASDDERVSALALQASLPSEFTQPADALGDDVWESLVQQDLAGGGEMAAADFRARWDWEMTPQQRADMLSRAVMDREMKAFINASAVPRPVVDPLEFADGIRASRMERARGVVL